MAETAHLEASAEGSSQAHSSQDSTVYEVAFHVLSTVGEEGVSAQVEKIRKALGDAEIIAEGFPQKMTLAYIIERSVQGKREKYSETYFGWIKFATEPQNLPGFEEALRGMKEILRSLVIKTVRENVVTTPRRAIFTSDRLEGETIKKPTSTPEKGGEVSEEELNKSIDALVN